MALQGRVAFITGAGSGIGAAAAKRLARDGVRIAAVGRSDDELVDTVKEIKGQGGEAVAVVADISDPAAVERAYADVAQRWGRIDIVFANAGINGVWAPLEELKVAEWQQTIGINLSGTFYTIKFAVPYLKRNGGSIIVTSSVNGTRIFSNTGATAYSTSKAGQVALTKMVALELAQFGIRANVICPGAIETNIDQNTEKRNLEDVQIPVEFPESNQPLTHGQPGRAEQVAELVLFLASDASSHITGSEMWIDGGESLIKG